MRGYTVVFLTLCLLLAVMFGAAIVVFASWDQGWL